MGTKGPRPPIPDRLSELCEWPLLLGQSSSSQTSVQAQKGPLISEGTFGSTSGFPIYTPSMGHSLATQPSLGLALSPSPSLSPGSAQGSSTPSKPRAPGVLYN